MRLPSSGPLTGWPAAAAVATERLEGRVTRREQSLFSGDLQQRQGVFAELLDGARILVIGGGGSIGSITTKILLDFEPAVLHVVDQSENYLAEWVRDLRGRPEGIGRTELRALPLDYGSPIMARLLAESTPYDMVLNFAALKHVRSEKDTYSLLQMLDTNLIKPLRFQGWLRDYGHGRRYFAVSTDKAANPVSLMGASKRLLEDVIFATASGALTTSARFANVAFSNGSLLQGLLLRLAKRQPLAVPRNTRRYFISHREAGEICVLASLGAPNLHIVFPRLDPARELQGLEDIAGRVLEAFGLTPRLYEEEEAARRAVESLARQGRWPLLLTSLDTSGEKPYEEFVGCGETAVEIGMTSLAAIRYTPSKALETDLFEWLATVIDNPATPIDKQALIRAMAAALPNFSHVETRKNLDQRL